jgi:hypothetical protein
MGIFAEADLFRGRGAEIGGEIIDARRGEADCFQRGEAAGIAAAQVNVIGGGQFLLWTRAVIPGVSAMYPSGGLPLGAPGSL